MLNAREEKVRSELGEKLAQWTSRKTLLNELRLQQDTKAHLQSLILEKETTQKALSEKEEEAKAIQQETVNARNEAAKITDDTNLFIDKSTSLKNEIYKLEWDNAWLEVKVHEAKAAADTVKAEWKEEETALRKLNREIRVQK